MGRIDRVRQELRHQISLIVQQELNDPRIGFVTITNVTVTADLQHARVFFSILGDESSAEAAKEGLNSAAGFVRRLIGQRMRMKFTPHIEFVYDEQNSPQSPIEDIIDKIHKEKEAGDGNEENHKGI